MTLRCKRSTRNQSRLWPAAGLSILLGLTGLCTVSAHAQDGAQVPPPPVLRHKRDNSSSDADFVSPMHNAVDNSGGFEQGRRFQQRMNGGFGGGSGDGAGGDEGRFAGKRGRFGGGFGGGQDGLGAQQEPFAGRGGRFGGGGGLGPADGNAQFGARLGRGRMGGRQGGVPGLGAAFTGGRKQLDLRPLNLSDEQKQRIRQIRQGTRAKARDVRHELVQRQLALRSLIFSPEATNDQIRQARKELRSVQDRMEEINLDDLLSIRNVLTAEQKQHLPEIAPGAQQTGIVPRGGPAISQRRSE